MAACDTTLPEPPDACTEVVDRQCWTFLGPEGMFITALADTPWGLFAGTRRGYWGPRTGVHRRDPATGRWHYVGLDHAIVGSMLMVPGATPRLLVGMRPFAEEQTDAAVFATTDGGRSWEGWDGGLAYRNDRRKWAISLAKDPDDHAVLFMGENGVLRSGDGGRTWSYVLGDSTSWGGGVHSIFVSPARDGRIWVARTTAFSTAFIDRTADWGATWEHLNQGNFNNSIYVLIGDPENADRLWSAEAAGRVRRSLDGGTTWQTSLQLARPGSVMGLVLTGGTLYAATVEEREGEPDDEDGALGLYRSGDGGESWASLPVPTAARGATRIVLAEDGALLVATSQGIWRASGAPSIAH